MKLTGHDLIPANKISVSERQERYIANPYDFRNPQRYETTPDFKPRWNIMMNYQDMQRGLKETGESEDALLYWVLKHIQKYPDHINWIGRVTSQVRI